jgi:hypothetical protein
MFNIDLGLYTQRNGIVFMIQLTSKTPLNYCQCWAYSCRLALEIRQIILFVCAVYKWKINLIPIQKATSKLTVNTANQDI